jgi:DNA ligase (NAD+)
MLIDNGLVKNVSDIYKLQLDAISNLERMGEKSAANLLNAIDKSKSNGLSNLLYALGIRQIGKKAGKILAKSFKSMDNVINAPVEEFTGIFDIGGISAENIFNFFKSPQNIHTVNELKACGVNMEYTGDATTEIFLNKTFVLTGTLPTLTRAEATKIIEDNGGKTSSSVSKKTDYVLAGDDAGSKLKKAVDLEIAIIDEDEFLTMVE